MNLLHIGGRKQALFPLITDMSFEVKVIDRR